jgi:hypothetical protein
MRKNKLLTGLLLSAALLTITSCEKSGDLFIGDVEGTYIGSFSKSTSLKSALFDGSDEHDGIAEVTMMGENEIQVHCYGNEIDTTFILDYYEHNDSVMVCLTGGAFENEYGHMLGGGHMSGGMMGHMSTSQTDWMHHMEDDHDDGDEHFGGFNMHEGTFTYSFRLMDDLSQYYLKFYGIKE